MSLDEEIVIYQFAQGVHSAQAMLDSFGQLDKEKRYGRLFDLFSLVRESKVIPSDAEQAMAESSFESSYTRDSSQKPNWSKYVSMNVPEGDLAITQDYTFLLYLIRATYQRRLDEDKGNPANWWCQDLSDSEVVKGLLTKYDALVEELYTSPSYRSEFRCIAKLWHEYTLLREGKKHETDSAQVRSGFLSYDELVDECVTWANEPSKFIQPMSTLRHSLEKGLAKRYKLDRGLIRKLVSAVMDRHLRETYNTGLV